MVYFLKVGRPDDTFNSYFEEEFAIGDLDISPKIRDYYFFVFLYCLKIGENRITLVNDEFKLCYGVTFSVYLSICQIPIYLYSYLFICVYIHMRVFSGIQQFPNHRGSHLNVFKRGFANCCLTFK